MLWVQTSAKLGEKMMERKIKAQVLILNLPWLDFLEFKLDTEHSAVRLAKRPNVGNIYVPGSWKVLCTWELLWLEEALCTEPRLQAPGSTSQVWVLSITVLAFDERLTVSTPGSLSLPTEMGTLDYWHYWEDHIAYMTEKHLLPHRKLSVHFRYRRCILL